MSVVILLLSLVRSGWCYWPKRSTGPKPLRHLGNRVILSFFDNSQAVHGTHSFFLRCPRQVCSCQRNRRYESAGFEASEDPLRQFSHSHESLKRVSFEIICARQESISHESANEPSL
ncbi:hypothetical protein DFH06DRAFT_734431 [Mycena polygramma]|nr:hypothetical protein DFH06DRAFT_734431 [Mycena polygramma]